MSSRSASVYRWIVAAFAVDLLAFPIAFLVWRELVNRPIYGADGRLFELDLVVAAASLLFAYAMGLYRVEGLRAEDLRVPMLAALVLSVLFAATLSAFVGRPELIRTRWLFLLPIAFWILFANRWIFCQLSGAGALDLVGAKQRRKVELDGLGLGQPDARLYPTRNPVSRGLKRVMDVAAGSALLLFTLPVSAAAMLAIFFEDGGPIFYRQARVGLNGRVFRLYKFRSMRCSAEADGVARWAQVNDTRVTRVGRFLRRSRIDEIPQFINVLLGDMSLVGPRPERPEIVRELEQAIPNYQCRHLVKPGITGWAQINYPYGASVIEATEKTRHDFYYLKNGSLILDVLILVQTIRVILLGEGAR